MINQFLIIGQLKKVPVVDFVDDNEIVVEVRRNYKNNEGVFERDCFKCYLWAAISKKISLCCKEGDLVAIKGRLVEGNDNNCKILAEQVLLLNKNNYN